MNWKTYSPIRCVPSFRSLLSPQVQGRNAFTLVELMVVVSMLGALMILIGAVFSLLMRSEKTAMQSVLMERTISRLSEQFRKDVHETTSFVCGPGNGGEFAELSLTRGANGAIRYRVGKNGIERQLISQNSVTARDTFVLADCQSHFEQGNGTGATMLSIVVLRPGALLQRTPHAPIPRRRMEIQAHINSHQQLGAHEEQGAIEPVKEGSQ